MDKTKKNKMKKHTIGSLFLDLMIDEVERSIFFLKGLRYVKPHTQLNASIHLLEQYQKELEAKDRKRKGAEK